jgi:hypothetical protein
MKLIATVTVSRAVSAYILPIAVAVSFVAMVSTTSYVKPVATAGVGYLKATISSAIFLEDDVFASDLAALHPGKVVLDSVTATDDIFTTSMDKALFDSAAADDALVVTFGKVLSDDVTPTDELVSDIAKVFADAATPTDALAHDFGKVFADSATPADALVQDVGKVLDDSFTPSDAMVFSVSLVLSDSVTVTDSPNLVYTPGGASVTKPFNLKALNTFSFS